MSSYNFCLVDDHKLFRTGLRKIIEELYTGCTITEACDGEEFLDLLNIAVPDIVFLDIKMPENLI